MGGCAPLLLDCPRLTGGQALLLRALHRRPGGGQLPPQVAVVEAQALHAPTGLRQVTSAILDDACATPRLGAQLLAIQRFVQGLVQVHLRLLAAHPHLDLRGVHTQAQPLHLCILVLQSRTQLRRLGLQLRCQPALPGFLPGHRVMVLGQARELHAPAPQRELQLLHLAADVRRRLPAVGQTIFQPSILGFQLPPPPGQPREAVSQCILLARPQHRGSRSRGRPRSGIADTGTALLLRALQATLQAAARLPSCLQRLLKRGSLLIGCPNLSLKLLHACYQCFALLLHVRQPVPQLSFRPCLLLRLRGGKPGSRAQVAGRHRRRNFLGKGPGQGRGRNRIRRRRRLGRWRRLGRL
mmetsp:Transcript_15027/g.52757  ORF Transcript_15027/g.52757 Transcript_15027/m.52757 type:complete len:354 (-) Transcript_15027:512-1573(-)